MKKYAYALPLILIIFLFLIFITVYIGIKKEDKQIMKKEQRTKTTTKIKEVNIMDGISVNYHASIRINKNEKVIYFDPFKINANINDADYIFITHSHYDHYSEIDINKVKKDDTKFIITSDLEGKISKLGISQDNIIVVYPNDNYEVDDLKFETIPAYNINKTFHKKSYNWVGYNLNIDGVKYYVVGDSDITDEFKNVKCDVIFVPVGGTYTMTDSEAADGVNEINPKYAVPIHYGETGSKINAESFLNKLNKDIEGVLLD